MIIKVVSQYDLTLDHELIIKQTYHIHNRRILSAYLLCSYDVMIYLTGSGDSECILFIDCLEIL